VLLIGYGNPGRGDDGLGPALALAVEARTLPGVSVEIDYQLTVDHAALIAAHDLVVFADAAIGLDAPWRLSPVKGGMPAALGSHQVTPEAAVHLAVLLYGRSPPAWVLAIGGTAFGAVREGLSPAAQRHLTQAEAFIADWILRAASGRAVAEACG
jgi:hydrogenase maturation protease